MQSLRAEVVRRFKAGSPPSSSTALMAILHFIVGGTSGTGFLVTLQNTLREMGPSQPEVGYLICMPEIICPAERVR